MTPPPPAAAGAAPAVYPRRAPLAPVPRRPRRVSGPAKARPAPARRAAPTRNPVTAVATHPLLDRLIHGRAWIGIVTFALIGIVTMQLGLLKLNAGIGRALEHEGALQRENSALSVENSEVAAGDTVELQAAHMGMRLIPAGSLRFLSSRGSQSAIGRAVAALDARASGLAVARASSTSSEAPSSSSESEASSTSASTGESETSSAGTTGGEESSEHTASSETSQSSASASSEAPATSEHTSSGAESGAREATTAPSGESGGASSGPGG
jgi:hypothetical protein